MEQEQKPLSAEQSIEKSRADALEMIQSPKYKRFVVFAFNEDGTTSGVIQCGVVEMMVAMRLIDRQLDARLIKKSETSK